MVHNIQQLNVIQTFWLAQDRTEDSARQHSTSNLSILFVDIIEPIHVDKFISSRPTAEDCHSTVMK